jgi:hypothetical protein
MNWVFSYTILREICFKPIGGLMFSGVFSMPVKNKIYNIKIYAGVNP